MTAFSLVAKLISNGQFADGKVRCHTPYSARVERTLLSVAFDFDFDFNLDFDFGLDVELLRGCLTLA